MISSDYTVETLSNFDALIEKRNEIESFFDQFEKPAFFYEIDWLMTWHSHFGDTCKYLIFLVRKNNALVCFLPLCTRKITKYGIQYNILEIIGSERAGWTGLFTRGDRDNIYTLLIDTIILNKNSWDIAVLQRLRNSSEVSQFCSILRLRHVGYSLITMGKLYGLNKYDVFSEYFKSRKSKNRDNYLRYKRRLEKIGKLELRTSDDLEPSEVLANITKISCNSWQGEENSSIFSEKNPVTNMHKFHTDIITNKHKRIFPVSLILMFGGEPISYRYGIRLNEHYTSYATEYDNTHKKNAPGLILLYQSMEYLFGKNVNQIDYGIGEGRLKTETTDWEEDLYTIYIFKNSIKSNLLKLLRLIKFRLNKSAKN